MRIDQPEATPIVRLFSFTVFLSALLLFLIQPLAARLVLPYLGGAPAVWNACLFFFQTALLAGYGYAHLITTRLTLKRQAMLHLSLLAFALLFLPFGITDRTIDFLNNQTSPVTGLLLFLATSIGMPFLMISTGGPLLQRWYSQTSLPSARDPYFLYAASNLGSLIALFIYPSIIEPQLKLTSQSVLWACGFGALSILMAICSFKPIRASTRKIEDVETKASPIGISRRLKWIALAFAPSSLMYGVTTYLTTDLVSVPLLWALPLSIYLITFILVFARRRIISPWLFNRLMPLPAIVLAFLMLTKLPRPIWLLGGVHLLFLFVASTVCHGRLADDRPESSRLTEYYFWMSFGGALGGLFNALIAPAIFNTVIEYPLAIVACLLLRAGKQGREGRSAAEFIFPAAICILTGALALGLPRIGLKPMPAIVLTLAIPLFISYGQAMKPIRFGLAIGAVMLGSALYSNLYYGRTLHVERSFFGALRVAQDPTGEFHQLFHGNTSHGRQFIEAARQCEPLSYYHRRGPLGQIFENRSLSKIAIVGLGAGATICYSQPDQQWDIYEIDPAIVRIAGDSGYFTYLQKCSASPVKMIVGDARLRLREAPAAKYDLIVLDAFSSDVIPVHLLTREAFDLYLSKLAPGGALALHTSNQYLDLQPVIANLISAAGLSGLFRTDLGPFPADKGKDSSQWMIVARNSNDLKIADARWTPLVKSDGSSPWTDDYSNVFGTFKW